MSETSRLSGISQRNGLIMKCKLLMQINRDEEMHNLLSISSFCRSKEYPPMRGYRDKERDRKSRDDRYGRRNYNSNKHSNSRSRWPQESYQASSSGHHKRHEGLFTILSFQRIFRK